WEAINKQKDFYDVQDLVDLGRSLTSEKLRERKEDDVVIFDYSLDPSYLRGYIPIEEEGSSLRNWGADDDLFLRVPKDMLLESEQFDQIINSIKEPLSTLSRGSRLCIIDFPQCFDTYDRSLLNSVAEKLRLPSEGEATFMDAHSKRLLAMPGHEGFRTGISLRVPFKKPPELSKLGLSEDRFTLFISIPYLGRTSGRVLLGPESESVRLLDFKHIGVHVGDRRVMECGEGDDIGEILVHQARYMIFENNTMATFRSKEDSAKDQVPLHRFQERIGAFRAMIHMIANRMNLELWALGKLQASLCKLEEDIGKIISDATTFEGNLGMEEDAADVQLPARVSPNESDLYSARENLWKRKQAKVRDLLTSLNTLSTALFGAINVAERQIEVLQDIRNLFSTSHLRKVRSYEQIGQNSFHKAIAPIPFPPGKTEQVIPGTLEAIDEVVRERKSFIKKLKGLVENLDLRGKILSEFLKSDWAKIAPSERIALETIVALKSNENTIVGVLQGELVKQGQTSSSITFMGAIFLPLSFCTSYFGMNNIREFNENPMSQRDFWSITASVSAGIISLTVILTFWEHPIVVGLRARLARKSRQFSKKKTFDIEN
ncbi:hypothetical protein HOY82DRAFT_621333, partial [Tuber indicum]